ncbi:hypothetical protein [Sedimentibacter sp. MB31-C6]|uniref:hypothetical protein n=1 Tax=Sedimentibacter sp. MB31-C6 TaxID=3109366 RepID=UPI002DDCA41D|nr:hypothetical protein [Sedimentibacter sp. MB36-C1]WSI02984.1 hypothetical protein U8307_07970 [Sedimentibacter sp. MB36-C1]
MMNQELLCTVIKTAVRSGLRYINDNPKRGVRNLLDLGEYFATGHFQKDFFNLAHDILNNDNSSYYTIIEKTVKNVNHNILTDFGMNIGYRSWTYGANSIRNYEKSHGYNIPWTIVFDFNEAIENQLTNTEVLNLIQQGKKIGIYSYMFMIENNHIKLDYLFPILEQNKDCAFVAFLNPKYLKPNNLCKLKSYTNIMLFILDSAIIPIQKNYDLLSTIKYLRKNKCLYGVYRYYNYESYNEIINGNYITELDKIDLHFAFLIKDENCSEKVEEKVNSYVSNSRLGGNAPVILMDFYNDIAHVDKNISVESCFLCIKSNGKVSISNINNITSYNTRSIKFEEILSKTMKKQSTNCD